MGMYRISYLLLRPLAPDHVPFFPQELAELRKNKLEWCDIQPMDDDIMRWTAMLVGPVRRNEQHGVGQGTTALCFAGGRGVR